LKAKKNLKKNRFPVKLYILGKKLSITRVRGTDLPRGEEGGKAMHREEGEEHCTSTTKRHQESWESTKGSISHTCLGIILGSPSFTEGGGGTGRGEETRGGIANESRRWR